MKVLLVICVRVEGIGWVCEACRIVLDIRWVFVFLATVGHVSGFIEDTNLNTASQILESFIFSCVKQRTRLCGKGRL